MTQQNTGLLRMSQLTDVLIDIARSQQVIKYGTTDLHQAIHDCGGSGETGAHARNDIESKLGPDTGSPREGSKA